MNNQNNDAVITGTYSDFKLIKTRQVAQMIIEVPLEKAEHIIKVFGVPKPKEEKWVAVAHMRTEKIQVNNRATQAIQQAGILGKDPAFGSWLRAARGMSEIDPKNHETIENAIRSLIGVRSRADMRTNEQSLAMWESLVDSYLQNAA